MNLLFVTLIDEIKFGVEVELVFEKRDIAIVKSGLENLDNQCSKSKEPNETFFKCVDF